MCVCVCACVPEHCVLGWSAEVPPSVCSVNNIIWAPLAASFSFYGEWIKHVSPHVIWGETVLVNKSASAASHSQWRCFQNTRLLLSSIVSLNTQITLRKLGSCLWFNALSSLTKKDSDHVGDLLLWNPPQVILLFLLLRMREEGRQPDNPGAVWDGSWLLPVLLLKWAEWIVFCSSW